MEYYNIDREPRKKQRTGAKPWQVAFLMLLTALLTAGIIFALLLSGATRYTVVDSKSKSSTALLSTLLDDIEKYYYFSDEGPSTEKLADAAAHSIVDAVGDPYAAYYSEEEYESFRSSISGNYKGIGVLVTMDKEKGLFVERVYEDTPAERAGLLAGDYISEVDGQNVIGMELTPAADLISGEDGSTVHLVVLRGEETLNIDAVRGDVYIRRVYTEQLENGIGYLRIESFTGNAATEFDAALDGLLESGITSLIIDVRGNPGGTLDTVVSIADRILPECVITTLEGKLVTPPEVHRSDAEHCIDLPLIVLTNGESASASEIFASAVQENGAGRILGTNTLGKGIVQTSWEVLPGQGYIKLTTDVYLTPNGNMIHGIGVAPDIEIAQDPELENTDIFFIMRDMRERDLQLNAAIELLNAQ